MCEASLHPAYAADHVLHDEGGRQHQAPDESPARGIVSAQQEEHRNQPRHRQQQSYQHGWHHHVAGRQRPFQFRHRSGVQPWIFAVRAWQLDTVRSRAKSAQ